MASVERMTFTQAVPEHATLRTEKGNRVACWTDRRGNAVKAVVLPTGRCRRTVPGRWKGIYRDHTGKKCKTEPYGDRSAALAEALDLERKGKAVREGREPASRPAARTRLIDLLPDYLTYLSAVRGAGAKRVRDVRVNVTRILAEHGLTTPGSVECGHLMRQLELDRQAGPPEPKPGRKKTGGVRPKEYSIRTRNMWVTMLRAFGKWLVKKAKAAAVNPFDELETTNDEPHKTRHRRNLPVESYVALVNAARQSSAVVQGLDGPDRAMLYTLGGFTGLRAGALRQLTPEAFTWAGGVPTAVYSSARMQKNKGAHGVSISPTIREQLGVWLKGRTPGQPVFSGNVHLRTADLIRHDLAAARVTWIAAGETAAERQQREASDTLRFADAAGQVFDFHALRVETAYLLFTFGASLPEVQQVLDHSTPTLTANVYAKFGGELADTMARIPALPGLDASGSLGTPLGSEGGSTWQNGVPSPAKLDTKETEKPHRPHGKR